MPDASQTATKLTTGPRSKVSSRSRHCEWFGSFRHAQRGRARTHRLKHHSGCGIARLHPSCLVDGDARFPRRRTRTRPARPPPSHVGVAVLTCVPTRRGLPLGNVFARRRQSHLLGRGPLFVGILVLDLFAHGYIAVLQAHSCDCRIPALASAYASRGDRLHELARLCINDVSLARHPRQREANFERLAEAGKGHGDWYTERKSEERMASILFFTPSITRS